MKQKHSFALTFIIISLFYLDTRWFIFLGFNGTDDLHYAMLASRMLNRTFDPFVPNDIFSGRILLIGFQSMIYQLGGIGVLSTQMGTLLATVWSCYLTVFKLIKPSSLLQIILACSFFYFNPVLTDATLGILPDAYIMLSGIYCVLILKNILSGKDENKPVQKALWLGIIIGLSLLIKEIAIVFLLAGILLTLIYKPRHTVKIIISLTLGFLIVVMVVGTYYYFHTGNFFFKLSQINNSDYRNTVHDGPDLKSWFERLTYGPWKIFIVHGFYPLLMATFFLLVQWITKGWLYIKNQYYALSFLILFFITLYFPFSLQEFKPLFVDARHFLFMLPLAVVISSGYISSYFVQARNSNIFLFFLCLLIICMISTGNKWQWMIYGFLTVIFFLAAFFKGRQPLFVLILCSVCWLSLLETVFFKNHPWFKDMQRMSKNISGSCFYFIDNDNMMHWELLHQFNQTDMTCYNMEKKPFFMFAPYYQKINATAFKPGWLIVNKVYPPPPVRFQNTLDSLKKSHSAANYIPGLHIEAFFIKDSTTLRQLINEAG